MASDCCKSAVCKGLGALYGALYSGAPGGREKRRQRGNLAGRLARGDPADPGREHMKALFWIGTTVLVLGFVSLVMPIPRNQREGFMAGGTSVGVETRYAEKVSPIASAVMILGGVSMMVSGKLRN